MGTHLLLISDTFGVFELHIKLASSDHLVSPVVIIIMYLGGDASSPNEQQGVQSWGQIHRPPCRLQGNLLT